MKNLKLEIFLFFWALSSSVSAQQSCLSMPTGVRYEFRESGAEVLDKRTGLIWGRCFEGTVWNGEYCCGSGSCTPSTFQHENALAYASHRAGWRLPTVRELSTLVEPGCQSPAIDEQAFPGYIRRAFWTSTPNVNSSGEAWLVDFGTGSIFSGGRSYGGYVVLLKME